MPTKTGLKEKAHRAEMLVTIMLAIVLVAWITVSYIPFGDMLDGENLQIVTGFVPAKLNTQSLNLQLDRSQSYMLTTNNEEQFYLTSLSISGNVIGDGFVRISLDDGTDRMIVYQNKREKPAGLPLITGRAISERPSEASWLVIRPGQELADISAELAAGEELVSGPFYQECEETCYSVLPMSRDISYSLVFEMEAGTELQLDNIIYTVSQ